MMKEYFGDTSHILERIVCVMNNNVNIGPCTELQKHASIFYTADEYLAENNQKNASKTGTLVITNSEEYAKTKGFGEYAMAGYGMDYQGKLRYIIDDIDSIDYSYYNQIYCHLSKIPWTVAVTDRTIIREMTEQDIIKMYDLYAGKQVKKYVEPLYPYAEELEFSKAYIENMYNYYGYGLWLVFLKSEPDILIGRVGLSHREVNDRTMVELGYIIADEYQHQGYAYECCQAIFDVIPALLGEDYIKKESILVCCNQNNLPSIKLALKLGFEYLDSYKDYNLYITYQGHSE